jgi:hypothetical protein
MAGRLQLETTGPQDAFFTDDPEYTYFVKNFQKHANYASFFEDLDVKGDIDFGNEVRCIIPQNQGDLLKTVSMKVELSAIDQTLKNSITNATGIGYNESIGHQMIEYVELLIGGEVIQRLTSDIIHIYSEQYVTQTKQTNLSKLIGKPPDELTGTMVMKTAIGHYLGNATSDKKYFVDIPFYFHNNPELAIPLHAIDKQEIEVVIKLRDVDKCIHATRSDFSNFIHYTGLKPKNLIKSLKLNVEMVCLDVEEKEKMLSSATDYIITQVQESKEQIPQSPNVEPVVVKHRLNFKNSVKELYFIIQEKRNSAIGLHFVTPLDYDHPGQTLNSEYINYEQLRNLELKLDERDVLDGASGEIISLRAVQSGIHHTRTQMFKRFYSYSFALEPERWYPTGQVNFSLIKDQLLTLHLNGQEDRERELRVYALSYNILRLEKGTVRLLF